MNLKIRYDQEDDALMVWFVEGKQVDHAERVGSSILHVSEHNEPILLEILNARDFVVELVRAVMTGSPETAATK